MAGTYSRIKTWIAAETLTASDLNAEHDNHITNADPDSIGDESANATEMRATADPYPASSESLASDLKGELLRLRYVIAQITGETYWYYDPDNNLYNMNIHNYGMFQRGQFTYNGGTTAYTIKVKSASYFCKDKFCWWDAELTTTAVGSPSANTFYYLYLDYSAITSGTEITNSELIWSSTAPSWNTTYKGWYNSDDRCIFAVLANSVPNNIVEFFHDGGDYIQLANQLTGGQTSKTDFDYNGIAVTSAAWDDVYLTVPNFCLKGRAYIGIYGAFNATMYMRVNGQTGTTGLATCFLTSDVDDNNSNCAITEVFVDSNGIMEITTSAAAANSAAVILHGWYLPIGL